MALPKVLRITHSTDNTTIVNNDQIVTVKDIAIDGILADLASVRGQIGNAVIVGTVDFNTLVKQGVYSPEANSTNGPNWSGQQLVAVYQRNVTNQGRRIIQYAFNATTNAAAMRIGIFTTGTEETPTSWSNWTKIISENSIGDGIRVTNGIISVPEYEGATASTAGTSGLVPPATAGEQNSVLHADGTWKTVSSSEFVKLIDELRQDVPGMAANAAAPNDKYIDFSGNEYTAQEDGYVSAIDQHSITDSAYRTIQIQVFNSSNTTPLLTVQSGVNIKGNYAGTTICISKGQKAVITSNMGSVFRRRFIYANGSAPA